jgi:cation diffusion facilitator family transporter
VGITSNLLLSCAKILIGFLTGSVAITADAVNNLSDCASSAITLIGFKLAGIPADEEHPYGHARFEYLSGLAVAVLVLVIGLEFLVTSVRKTVTPEPVSFSAAAFTVLFLSIGVKFWQGRFNKAVGERIGSAALVATAADSRNDVLTTSVVLVSSLIAHNTGWNLDGPIGIAVAAFILWSGVGLIRDTLHPLLGAAPEREMVELIQQKILSYDSVIGAHDLMVHNYGPGRSFASVHVEVPASQDVLVTHDIIDRIERDFSLEMQIDMVIHLDPVIVDDESLNELRAYVERAVESIDPALSVHDFRMAHGERFTNVIFELTVPPRYPTSDTQLRRRIIARVRELDPVYYCVITIDRSYTSSTGEMGDRE